MAALETAAGETELEAAWSQAAALKPRLVAHVDIVEHHYRGESWYVLADRMTASHFRCTPAVREFLALLDGEHRVQDAWALCAENNPDNPPQREEVLRLLVALQVAELLEGGAPPDSGELYEKQRASDLQRWWRRLASPLAIQLPLLDPDNFLQRCLPWVRPLLRPFFFWLWLLIVALAGVAAINLWSALGVHWQTRFLDPGNLLFVWLLYPLVKGLHEWGHGIATRAWGGEVHEMGIILLVFTPVPYVDASASSAFSSRYQRMLVAAAGIMMELLLSAIALMLWTYSAPGLLRDLCFNVMVIGGVSTLLFNGNPLLRFDGYYVLTDLLEMPNLRQRANQYLGFVLSRRVLDVDRDKPSPAQGIERFWLCGYALLAGAYRLFIGFTIALFVAGKFFFVGLMLAAWLVVSQVALPLYRVFSAALRLAREQSRETRLALVSLTSLALVGLVLFVIPVGHSSHAEGIVILPENAGVRSQAEGFIRRIYRRNGQLVKTGEPIFLIENQELVVREEVLLARRDELTRRYSRALSNDPMEATQLQGDIAALEREILDIRQQSAGLMVLSPHPGLLALPRAQDLPGRFVSKGELLAHVIDGSALSVRVVVDQREVDWVLRRSEAIEVRLLANPAQLLQGEQVHEVPQATTRLPSAVLGSAGGGDIAVDARDEAGLQALQGIFQLDVRLPADTIGPISGQRALVRFRFPREPLGSGWYRRLRLLLLERFEL